MDKNEPNPLLEKLKHLGVFSGAKGMVIPPHSKKPIEVVLGGELVETPYGAVLSIEKQFQDDYHHGKVLLDDIPISPIVMDWSKPTKNLPMSPKVVFLDTETSGLAGGTGTFAFMIGCGCMTQDGFKSTQLFMSEPGLEPALLCVLDKILYGADVIVTFNGKSFDMPVIRNRYVLHHMEPSFIDCHHIDILHLSRRIWRERLKSRRLGELEREILEFNRSGEDIPGWMVPEMYLDFLTSRDPAPLAGVFYHNRMDILSLGALLKHLSILIDNDNENVNQHGSDSLAIARLYGDQGLDMEAANRYEQLIGTNLQEHQQEIVYTQLANIYRKKGMLDKSIALLELATQYGSVNAAISLAKIYEHIQRNYQMALFWTEEAMKYSEIDGHSEDIRPSIDHRLQRIKHKIAKME
ncbi:MAG: ribonuclease H-like domain-containing protein [Anaerolineae bacterium]|nr:ribonuclease H-like domain-containing protein [Anaerolineae bacterium]